MEHPWRVKLRRADHHIESFAVESARYVEAANVGLRYERDPSTGTLIVRLQADTKAPLMLGAIVGDVLHNLRSALDAIAWEACQRAGVPKSQERYIYFPITRRPSNWPDRSVQQLPEVSEAHREIFRTLQPWYHDECARESGVDVPVEQAQWHPLARLNYLARIDRHRVPHPILTRAGATWVGKPDSIEVVDVTGSPGATEPGDIVYTWRVQPPEGVIALLPDGEVELTLPEGEAGMRHGQTAAAELVAMRRAVDDARRTLEVEVLEVVSAAEMDELAALRQEVRDADASLEELRTASHVVDVDYMSRYHRLRAELEAASRRYMDRWRELFD